MRRREILAGLAGVAASWSFAAGAQPRRMPVVGFLSSRSSGESARLVRAFSEGLQETGSVEGKAPAVDYRWADGHLDQLPTLAAELIEQQVNVLVVAGGSSSALAAQRATSSVPIVFVMGGDPVKLGLVTSLARPGGNATGINIISANLAPKRMDLLRELVPKARRVAVLTNPGTSEGQVQSADAIAAAHRLGTEVTPLSATDEKGIEAAFVALSQDKTDTLLVGMT